MLASADALLAAKAEILAKNKADVDAAVEAGIKGAFIDRLTLTEARLADMAEGLRRWQSWDDPVGEVLSMKTLDNGLVIGQKRVPMGVIGIIFEARPNVAADAFGLCLKAGQCGYSARREGGLSDESGGDFRFARRIGRQRVCRRTACRWFPIPPVKRQMK